MGQEKKNNKVGGYLDFFFFFFNLLVFYNLIHSVFLFQFCFGLGKFMYCTMMNKPISC